MRSRTGVAVVLAAAAVLALVAGALVLRGRGPGGDGEVDLGDGPEHEPERAWSVGLEDGSDVALLGDDERVYVVREGVEGDLGYDAPTVLTAYAAVTGDELWSTDLARDVWSEPVRNLGPDRVLVAGHGDPDTVAVLDADDGEVAWEAAGQPLVSDLAQGITVPIREAAPDDVVLLTRDERIVAVDRDDGEDLWSTAADDALACGDVVVTVAGSTITGRGATSGEERWSTDGIPGRCDEDVMAIGRTDGGLAVALVEVGSGEVETTLPVDGTGSLLAVPTPGHVVVSWFDLEGDDPSTGVVVHRRDGGAPTYEQEGAVAVPLTDELALVAGPGEGEARLVRLADGEAVGSPGLVGRQGACTGVVTERTAIVCAEGTSEVTAYALGGRVGTRWTVDLGAPVVEATVGGDHLFAVTTDDRLVALR